MKKFVASLSIIVSTMSFAQTAFADEPLCPTGTWSSLCNINANHAGGIVGAIVQVLLIIAILICLIFLVWGGVQYITSGGDKQKVAAARGRLFAAIIGLVISLLGFFIVNTVLVFFTGNGLSSLKIPKLYGN